MIHCLQRKLTWSKYNTQSDNSNEQFSIYPWAFADKDGFPHKGSKSNWTDKLQSRYQNAKPTVFSNCLLWTPDVVLINARPLRRTKTIADYTSRLVNQIVVQYYKAGINEIHLVFDNGGKHSIQSMFEHLRHCSKVNTNQHQHYKMLYKCFQWQDFLDC